MYRIKLNKILQFFILIVLIIYSCSERQWDNPYDPESNTEFTRPKITSIHIIDFNKIEINWLKKDMLYTI